MDHNHSARTVGLYQTDGSALTDTMKNGTIAPRHLNAHYSYDLREKAFQRGGTAIVNLLQTKYTGMMGSWFEFLEDILWSKPTDSTDTMTPFGILYWITRSATEGFNGGNPTGFTNGKADIDQGTYSRWANWTAQYAAITGEDVVRKMRKAVRKSKFRSPVSHATPAVGGMRNGIYLGDTPIGLMEELLESNNMNLGNDLDSKGGRTMFKGTPLTYAPKLDDDSTDPIYMLDWKTLAIGVMAGWENNLTPPYQVPDMHMVRRIDMDASLNMICTDLRRQAVLYK